MRFAGGAAFTNTATLPNGANANHVLGQTDFTSQTSGIGASKLYFPLQVMVDDATGALWATDSYNYRILRFMPVPTDVDLSNLRLVDNVPLELVEVHACSCRGKRCERSASIGSGQVRTPRRR